MKICSLLAFIMFLTTEISCKNELFDMTPSGLKYKIYQDISGPKISIGDTVVIHMIHSKEDNFEIVNTYPENLPIFLVAEPSNGKQSLMEGLQLLSEGDSAVFLLSSDSLYKAWGNFIDTSVYKKGSHVKYAVKILRVKHPLNR